MNKQDSAKETHDDRPERRRGPSQGEAAGGDRHDVPGGAYNVPSGMADEVSEEDAQRDRQRGKQSPER